MTHLRTSGKDKGLGGTKCLVSDTQVVELGTRDQTDAGNAILATTTLSSMPSCQGNARERIQGYLERSGQDS